MPTATTTTSPNSSVSTCMLTLLLCIQDVFKFSMQFVTLFHQLTILAIDELQIEVEGTGTYKK